jgi:PAS domain S-box-containing protein
MTDGRDKGPFGFERDKPGTNARTEAEADIEELRQRGGLFVEAVARTRMPMAVTDARLPGNPIVFANESFVRLSGYSMEEVLGQKPHFLNGPDTDPDDAARFREALRRGEDIVVDTWQYRKDGSRFCAAVFCSPVTDEDGQVVQHFLSYLDITRRAEAEQKVRDHAAELEQRVAERTQTLSDSQARLAAAFETVPVGVAVIDLSGVAIIANAEFRRFLPNGTIPSRDRDRGSRWRAWGPDGQPIAPQDFPGARALRGENTLPGLDMLYTDDDGREVWTNVATAATRDEAGRITGCVAVISDIDLRKRSAEALLESEERLRRIVASATDYAIFATDPQGIITDWMPGAEAVFGWSAEEAIGRPADMTFVPEDRATDQPEKEMATAAREGLAPNIRWHIRKDGSRVFIEGTVTPLTDEAGRLRGYLKIGQDTTERRSAEQRQKTLLAELQHRVRNTLGVVRAIARRTAQNSASVEELSAHLEGRLDAFARVQSMVTRRPEAGVDLALLVEEELIAHAAREGNGVSLDGPEVALAARPAETLSLAIHELTTNAVKYGALNAPDGRLAIRWTLAVGRLELVWTESGVPGGPAAPEHEGFGMELLRRVVPYELSAETAVDFLPDGFRFTLSMPAEGNLLAR